VNEQEMSREKRQNIPRLEVVQQESNQNQILHQGQWL